MDDKISIEIQHLDEKVTKFMETFSELGKHTVDEFEANVKSNEEYSSKEGKEGKSKGNSDSDKNKEEDSKDDSSSDKNKEEESGSSKSTNESSENDNEQIDVMKSEYIINNEITDDEWKLMNKETLNLKTSWTAVQNDLSLDNRISYQLLMNVSNNIENLYIYSNNKDRLEFIREVLEMYSNIIEIADKIDIDANKLNLMKIKYEIYQAYYSVLNNDWDMAKNKVNKSKEYLKELKNMKESDKVLIETMDDSVSSKNQEKFLVKYNFIMKNLKDYNA